MDSHQENYGMSSFPELDNLIDTAQIQAEQLLDQPISMDEGMDFKIIIGMNSEHRWSHWSYRHCLIWTLPLQEHEGHAL